MMFQNYSFELQMWWRECQKADADRLNAEKLIKETDKLKKAALAKLTKEERKALGL